MGNTAIERLLTRRSVLARNMTEPGPDAAQTTQILTAAARVPDHGKIAPWRFILLRGEGRQKLGTVLRDAYRDIEADASEAKLALESEKFTRAPLVIAVVSSPLASHKVPVWEQQLSCGAACQNILHAADALGFAAQWITEWCAYHPKVLDALGVTGDEQLAGFIYIGTAIEPPQERPRPELETVVTDWQGPLS